MQSNIVWNVANIKKCKLQELSEVEKLQLKNSRPTPGISITQDCNSSGMKFLFTILIKTSGVFHLLRFILIVLYSRIAKSIQKILAYRFLLEKI